MKNLYNALLLKQLYQLKNLGFRYTNIKEFSYKEQNSLELPNSLIELKKQAINCHLCSLSKSRKEVIFGEGSSKADVMFIGNIPLEIENEVGKIALGRSGEMLIAMIEKVLKIPRNEVYITNLLKCHPPATEKPHETSFHTCKAYLFKEIDIIKPKVIITLGKEPYHYLTNDNTDLKEIIGKSIKRKNYTIVPTYHPNFLLKNPSFKKEVLLNLQNAKKLLQK